MNEPYNNMDYFENIEGISKEVYYHYTSLESLYSIVTSKTFRLTSLKSSNDKKEFCYSPDEFIIDFSKVCIDEGEDTKKFFQQINKSIEVNKASFYKLCRVKSRPYALCLSEKKDNLTHWDRYANGCSGVCIGFNTSSLRVYMQRMSSLSFGIGLYDIEKIIYASKQKISYIQNELTHILSILCHHRLLEDMVIEKYIQENGYMYASLIFRQLMKFSKDSSFIDEDEVRLYHDATSIKDGLHLLELLASSENSKLYRTLKKNFSSLVNQLQIEEEKFFVAKNGIRSYRNLCLQEIWGAGTIPEIILGPMCIQSKNELRFFLNSNGLKGTKVSVSKVPIR